MGLARACRHLHMSTNVYAGVDQLDLSPSLGSVVFSSVRLGRQTFHYLRSPVQAALTQCSASGPRPAQSTAKLRLAQATTGTGGESAAFYASPKGRTSRKMSSSRRYGGPDKVWFIHSLD